jgi:hypothetical protein
MEIFRRTIESGRGEMDGAAMVEVLSDWARDGKTPT